MSATESKAGESLQRSVQQQSAAEGTGVDVGGYLQQVAENQQVEINIPSAGAGVDVAAIVQQVKKITGLDMLISYIQVLGMWVTVDIWPSVFSQIFSSLALPFSLNLPEFGVSRVTVFYVKMLVPLVLVGCWKLLLRSPFQWKKTFILHWKQAMMQYMGFSLVAGVAITLFVWMPSSTREVGIAIGFGVLVAACMYLLWYCVMSFFRYQYISAADERLFFVQFRATMRTMLLLLLVVIYLPVSQAVADMIVYQLKSAQLHESLQPLHLTVAFVCLVAYVIAIPAGLFVELRNHCRSAMAQTDPVDGAASPKTPSGPQEGVTLLVDQGSMSLDFLAEGQQADEMATILSMLQRSRKLRSDLWRRRAIAERLEMHRRQEAIGYADAVNQYESKFGGNPFSRIAMPFDDGKYWWKCVQLVEKYLLVFIIALAADKVAQLSGSAAVEGVMLIVSFTVQPFKDEDDGTVAMEDRLDVATRAVMFLTVFSGLMLALFDASAAARTAVDVILVVVVLANILLILYQLDIRELLLKAYQQLLAIPHEIVQWMRRRQEGKQKTSKQLYEYVKAGNLYAVQSTLARRVADIDWRNEAEGNKSCLHVCNNSTIMRELLIAGADLRVTDDEGKTPLHFMYEGGFGGCIELLLHDGARVDVRCNAGKLPEDYLDAPRAIDAIVRARRVDDMAWLTKQPVLDNFGEDIFISWLRFSAAQKAWEVFPFIIQRFPGLSIPLGELDLQPEGFMASAAALKERNFERLDLVGNDITTRGQQSQPVRLMADLLLHSTRLVELDLRGNNITWEMATWLAEPIRKCPTLVRLNGYDFSTFTFPVRVLNLDMRLKSSATVNQVNKEMDQLRAYQERVSRSTTSLPTTVMEQLKVNHARLLELERGLQFEVREVRDEPLYPYETAFVCQQLKDKEVEFLSFRGAPVLDEGAFDVAELLKAFAGRALVLANSDMSDVGLRFISAALRDNCAVKELSLSGNDRITPDGLRELFTALVTNTNLERLHLEYVGHNRQTPWPKAQGVVLAEGLATARHLRQVITTLGYYYPQRIRGDDGCTFFDSGFADQEFGELYQALLPFNQSATTIGLHLRADHDQALALAGVSQKAHLLTLDLCKSGLGDESTRVLCEVLATLPNLQHLSLRGCSDPPTASNRPHPRFASRHVEAVCDALMNCCPKLAHLDVRQNVLLFETLEDGSVQRTDAAVAALKRLMASKESLLRLWVGPTIPLEESEELVRLSKLFEGVDGKCRIYTGDSETPVLGHALHDADYPVKSGDVILVHPTIWTNAQMDAFRCDGLWPQDDFDGTKQLDAKRDNLCRVTAVDRKWDGTLQISGRFLRSLGQQNVDVLNAGLDRHAYCPAYNFTLVTDSEVLEQVRVLEAQHEATRNAEPASTSIANEQKENQTAATLCDTVLLPGSTAAKVSLCHGCHMKRGQQCIRCNGVLAGQIEAAGCQQCSSQHHNKCAACRQPLPGMSKPAMVCQSCTNRMLGRKLCSFFKRR